MYISKVIANMIGQAIPIMPDTQSLDGSYPAKISSKAHKPTNTKVGI